jgi:N-acetyl sugar amidotransferase
MTALHKINYRVCNRCVMDTSDPDIGFDEAGICNHCKIYETRAARELFDPSEAKAKLDQLVSEIRKDGESKPYDCIIGISGGVDSTMVAYLVKNLGLRPLAVHLDNGWDTELAVYNIEKTLKVLNIDLFTHVIDWEEFRDLQMSFLKASVANIEIPTDHAIMAILFKMASQYKIKYLISGGNVATEAIMPGSWMYDNRDLRHIRAIHRRFGTIPLKTYPLCSLKMYAYYVLLKGIKYIPILNYINYNKREAKALIQRELGWRDYGGKHYESIFTRFFQAYILPRKFNIDKRRAHFSALICSGQMSRETALKELEIQIYPDEILREDYDFFLKKMRLTKDEFESIMSQPPKNFDYYPSNSFVFKSPWIIQTVKKIVKPKSLKTAFVQRPVP